MSSEIKDCRSFGKGEVVSSILTGSTTNAHELRAFEPARNPDRLVRYATEHEHDGSSRGKSVEFVHREFRAWAHRRGTIGWDNIEQRDAALDVQRWLWVCCVNSRLSPFIVGKLAESVAKLERAYSYWEKCAEISTSLVPIGTA